MYTKAMGLHTACSWIVFQMSLTWSDVATSPDRGVLEVDSKVVGRPDIRRRGARVSEQKAHKTTADGQHQGPYTSTQETRRVVGETQGTPDGAKHSTHQRTDEKPHGTDGRRCTRFQPAPCTQEREVVHLSLWRTAACYRRALPSEQ